MAEFLRLQLMVGDDLNTSLRAMYADLEATAAELVRDLDITAQNSTALPSENPAIGVALHRFMDLVRPSHWLRWIWPGRIWSGSSTITLKSYTLKQT